MRTDRSSRLLLQLLVWLLVSETLAVRDPVSDSGEDNSLVRLDGYEDSYTHFHVTPSTHVATLKSHSPDEAVELAVIFALHPAASVLGLTLPPGYTLAENPTGEETCPQVFTPSEDKISAYAKETQAEALTPDVVSCEVSGGLDAGNASTESVAKENEDEEEDEDESKKQREGARMEITMKLKPDIPFLSAKGLSSGQGDKEPEEPKLKWWYFHVMVQYPEHNPLPEENFFKLHWASDTDGDWEGQTVFHSWPILGDWECRYSDWEGWGTCSARCGGGVRQLTRRVLEKPPVGTDCDETVHPDAQPCNEHPCLWGCEATEEWIEGDCSASCGGGVKFKRRRFQGEYCPRVDDPHSEMIEAVPCNTQPCHARCILSDKWEVVTTCDEICGMGHFWLMRKVKQMDTMDEVDPFCRFLEPHDGPLGKPLCADGVYADHDTCLGHNQKHHGERLQCPRDAPYMCDDKTGGGNGGEHHCVKEKKDCENKGGLRKCKGCLPEWRRMPCMRQVCTKFTVSRPDANLLPYPEDLYRVAMSWSQELKARMIRIIAPEGYSFGAPSSPCTIIAHSLMPHYQSCQVDSVRENKIEITLVTPLPPAEVAGAKSGASLGRYELQVDITNPPCADKDWKFDPVNAHVYCDVNPDNNNWQITFASTGSTVEWATETAQGYLLHWHDGMPLPDIVTKVEDELGEEEAADLDGDDEPQAKEPEVEAVMRAPPPPEEPQPRKTRKIVRPVFCRGDRDPAFCQDKFPGSACNWMGVCAKL